jgi:Right handed beta helix region
MKRFQLVLTFFMLILIYPACAQTPLWNGIISPTRAIDWTKAGIPGGLPDANWTQCGATIAPYTGTAAAINTALASCGANQFVQLGAGTFTLSTGIALPFNTTGHLALRGMGANSTFLLFSGSAPGCNAGQSAFMCMQSSDGTAPGNGGLSIVNWTGGYAQGSTQITLSSVSGIVPGKTLLILNQCDTGFSGATCSTGSATDNGNYFVCSALYNGSTGCSVNGPDGSTWRPNGWQQETVLVTAVNAGGCGATCVTIGQPIEHPNWVAGQSPQAVITQPVPQDGIENLTIDGTATTSVGAAITLFNTYQCWVSGVKIVNSYAYGVYMLNVSHSLIKDNYFYRSNGHPDAYAVRVAWGGDDVIQNNIFEQWKNSYAADGPAPGEVIAYNFSVNQVVPSPNDFMWTAFWSHSTGDDFHLREGNAGDNDQEDNTHGSHLSITKFRNFFWGWESCANGNCGSNTSKTLPLDANIDSSNVRYANLIANVLGTPGVTTTYQHSAAFGSFAAFDLGAGNGSINLPNDPLVASTMLRWGNYDVVTGAARWCGSTLDTGWSLLCSLTSEIPTLAPLFPNTLPTVGDIAAGQPALPASFYLTTKPSWFGSLPWPAIGPDVTGGNIGQCSGTLNTPGKFAGLAATSSAQCAGAALNSAAWGGHVNTNPAMNCFLNVLGGKPDGTGSVLPFDANACYGGGGTVSQNPAPPTGLSLVINTN